MTHVVTQDINLIRRRLSEGAPCSVVAKECGVSRQRIYQLVSAHGLNLPPKKGRAEGRLAFDVQRNQARQRSIGWELTFQEWWSIWQQSGKWTKRGRTKGCYVMARPGDLGPYKVGNVYITTHSDNAKTAQSHARRPPAVPRKEPHPKGGFTVRFGHRGYHGYYKTAEEAEAKMAWMRAELQR